MSKATIFNANIEKMDNGWCLYVSGDYPPEVSYSPEPGADSVSVNVREVYETLNEVLDRVRELS